LKFRNQPKLGLSDLKQRRRQRYSILFTAQI